MNTNKTALEWISDLALRLATIAHDPEMWEDYKTVETDTKGVVIDRTENNLLRYVRDCESHFSALYDADYQQDIENAKLEQQITDMAEVLQVFAQFHNITEEYENEYVQVRVPVSALHEARRLLGGAFRDLSNSGDIPV